MRSRKRPSFEARYAALFVPGARVRLTGAFLARTGQQAGGRYSSRKELRPNVERERAEGEKVWTVRVCPCPLCAVPKGEPGAFVALDERSAADPERWRHAAVANLMVLGAPLRASDSP